MKAVLVEATSHDGTGTVNWYFSDRAYTPSDTADEYDDVIADTPVIEVSLDRSVSVGGVRLLNNGAYDAALDHAWEGWPITIWEVATNAPRSTAVQVFNGVMGPIRAPDENTIELTIRDANAGLDAPVQTALLPDGEPLPICLGRVFNISPKLTNAATHEYQVHDGPIVSATPRAGGLPVAFTPDYANGKFRLNVAPQGDVTCDVVQADQTPQAIIANLALRVGVNYDGAAINTADHGIYIREQTSALEAIQRVARSIGGAARVDAAGEVGVYVLSDPGTPVVTVAEDDVLEGTLRVLTFEQPSQRIRLGYQRNWTRQTSLLGAVTAANRKLYGDAYLIVESDNALGAQWPLPQQPDVVDSLFWDGSDAQTESDRRAALRAVKRGIYPLTVDISTVLKVGDTITLDHSRYGFAGGVDAVVVRNKFRPGRNRQEIQIWR